VSPFNPAEARTLFIVTLVGASLSFVGCVFVVLSYACKVTNRTFPFKLVMWLCVANAFSSVAYFVSLLVHGDAGIDKDGCDQTFGCLIGAIMTQFFDVASFLWMGVIAFNMYKVMVSGVGREAEGYERSYHCFAWGFSFVLVLGCLFTGSFGDAGNWCWIKQNHQAARFGFYYFPLLSVFVYNCACFYLVQRSVGISANRETITSRLLLYVGVFLFFRVWSVVNRSQQFFAAPLFALALLHTIFSPLQGFANALLYGCSNRISCLCWKQDTTITTREHEFSRFRSSSSCVNNNA